MNKTMLNSKQQSYFLPRKKSMAVRRQILNRILRFRISFARNEFCERTIENPISHTNQGKATSATYKPFQTERKYGRLHNRKPLRWLTCMFKKPIATTCT
jgi:hypothetical protein